MRPRGFALLKLKNPEKLSEISSKAGTRAHELGVAHEWDKEEATEMGKKGGIATKKIRGENK